MNAGGRGCILTGLLVLSLIAGCGGGGGGGTADSGSQISGTASAGAVVTGKVYLKDSSNPAKLDSVDINRNTGNFTFPNTSQYTLPVFLQALGTAGGQSVELYSIATDTGTTNVNPMTNLVVASIAAKNNTEPAKLFNDNASSYLNSLGSNNAVKTAVQTAITDIKSMLQPLLTADNLDNSSSDFMHGQITLGQGVDKVFDQVKIDVKASTQQVSITNKADSKVIGSTDLTLQNTAAITSGLTTVAAGLTAASDLQDIDAMLQELVVLFNTKRTNVSNGDLEQFVAHDYGYTYGYDRTFILSALTTANVLMGGPDISTIRISSISGLSIDGITNGTYKVSYLITWADGTVLPNLFTNNLIKENGKWKFTGNGAKFQLMLFVRHTKYQKNGGTMMKSALQMEFDNPLQLGAVKAIITGKGLPAGGVILDNKAKPNDPTRLYITPAQQDNEAPGGEESYTLSDSAIAQMGDNEAYTITVYDSNNNVLDTFTFTVPKRPLMSTELTAAHFPTIGTLPSAASLPTTTKITIPFSKPAAPGFTTTHVEAELSYSGAASGQYGEYNLGLVPLSQPSATITYSWPVSWTPVAVAASVHVYDVYWRDFAEYVTVP